MNRIDRLYALVEELRAAGPRGRTARQLAEHFEVSVRTVERDLSALGQAGVPISGRQGRSGGYVLDRSMSLPPLNFTPGEVAAVAVALSRSEHVLWARDARSAFNKIVAAMPERAVREAQHVVVGPNGSYLTAWCHLRNGDRVFRMDRITAAERTPRLPRPEHPAPEPLVDGLITKLSTTQRSGARR